MIFILLLWFFVSLSCHWSADYAGAGNSSYKPSFIITTVLFIIYYLIIYHLTGGPLPTSVVLAIFVLILIAVYIGFCIKYLQVPTEGIGYFCFTFLLLFVISFILTYFISRSFTT